MPPSDPSYIHRQLLVEFASLHQTSPPGIYLTLSPTVPTKPKNWQQTWNGVAFLRRGSYSGAILRFTLDFPESSLVPKFNLQTRVFHPLVDPKTGGFSVAEWKPEDGISELLEYFKAAFENEETLDKLTESEVCNLEAWKSWNGRRQGTGGWADRVETLVKASQTDSLKGGDEMVLLREETGEVERKVLNRAKGDAEEELRERAIKIREY